jgi:hypothetical protein
VGPRTGLDRCEKSRLPPGFDSRTVQPLASRYTDYVIPAHLFGSRPNNKPISINRDSSVGIVTGM